MINITNLQLRLLSLSKKQVLKNGTYIASATVQRMIRTLEIGVIDEKSYLYPSDEFYTATWRR